jgi:hypothetical protein
MPKRFYEIDTWGRSYKEISAYIYWLFLQARAFQSNGKIYCTIMKWSSLQKEWEILIKKLCRISFWLENINKYTHFCKVDPFFADNNVFQYIKMV